jgi:hypothetical protein
LAAKKYIEEPKKISKVRGKITNCGSFGKKESPKAGQT